jgi:hypothetical protein
VEDEFAEALVRVVIRYTDDLSPVGVEIHRMGGYDPARSVHIQHSANPSVLFPSVCLLDGDQPALADENAGVFKLPGDLDPESHIIGRILEVLDAEASRLALVLQLPTSLQGSVKDVVRSIVSTNRDRHVFFQQVGDALEFTAAQVVRDAFLAVWAQNFPDEVAEAARGIRAVLNAPTWKVQRTAIAVRV